jgi:hypothetical protein
MKTPGPAVAMPTIEAARPKAQRAGLVEATRRRQPPLADIRSRRDRGAMRRTDVPMFLVATGWAYLLWSGLDGLLAIRSRHIPGYPAAIPALALALLAAGFTLSRTARWFYDIYPLVVVASAFAFFPVILAWGGGV